MDHGVLYAASSTKVLADTVRILATPDGVSRLPEAARSSGHFAGTLRTMMIGYRHGGPAGSHAALRAAPTPPSVLERARDSIRASRALVLGDLEHRRRGAD
ncbi:hypothetical protein [Streptomyces sp. NPDC046985]|uniref:hypothetical protein n=1 Tax=Streptomyces sp. NPDC046985 TaxID=3155377 RepID=UPI0034069027